jgi:hypothetical protein
MELNPATPASFTAASEPPVIIISAFSMRIRLKASIMACDADAHADTVVKFGPLKWYLMEINPPAILAIILGIKKGENRGFSSWKLLFPQKRFVALQFRHPRLLRHGRGQYFHGQGLNLQLPEQQQPCILRVEVKLSGLLTLHILLNIEVFTSQANLVLCREASNLVMGAAPLTPFLRLSQNSVTVFPKGLTVPTPVITTRLNSINEFSGLFYGCFNVCDGFANS